MSLARHRSGGGSTRGAGPRSEQSGTDGKTITTPSQNTTNLPATHGGATGAKNPKRPQAGFAKFSDVLEPGGQENP